MKIYYKIIDNNPFTNEVTFIHFGLNGSKKIKFDKWLKATEKPVIDGSKGTRYTSGFHVFESLEDAIEYRRKFKKNYERKEIARVNVKGIREKTHSRAKVFLAKQIKFESVL